MILFWILCAAMLLVAALFVALPLWRKSSTGNDVVRDAANLDILRDQATELEVDLHNGLLTQEAYDQGRGELQSRLLEEVKITEQPAAKPSRNPAKVLAIMLAVLLPVVSVSLYLTLGNLNALSPQDMIVADAEGVVHSAEALKKLEDKVKRGSNDPSDWWMLARTYTEQKKFSDASNAYGRLVVLVPNEAQIWANYADVYAMANGQTLQNDEVTKMISKSLELDPGNNTALALAGSAAMERGDYVTAITRWQALVDQLGPGTADGKVYVGGLKRAAELLVKQPGGKKKLAQLTLKASAKSAKDSATALTGKVSLSRALAGKVSPDDTVFILARAAQGPKMPLAVMRKQVKDLPLKFTLDDSMAMQPQLKLSGFAQVVVVARVSKSGSPMSQAGDLQGMSSTIKPGAKGLNIVIDTVMP
jgi:cytochrome c-type biogenesis protein CcmH